MVFSGSQMSVELMQDVGQEVFHEALKRFFSVVGHKPSQCVLDFLSTVRIRAKLNRINDEIKDLCILPADDGNAIALRSYLFANRLVNICDVSPFDEASVYPDEIRTLAKAGGEGLYRFGLHQFQQLRSACDDLCVLICRRGWRRVTLIESPLGNVIPVYVLRNLLERAGICVRVLSLGLPRNEKASTGLTFKAVIRGHISEIVQDTDSVVYMDDVLSGSRYLKILRSLRAEMQKNNSSARLLPCALVFDPLPTLDFTWTEAYIEKRRSLNEELAKFSDEYSIQCRRSMPGLPQITLGPGESFAYESSVVWGAQEHVAGMKKVNFVFNILEQFQGLLNDAISETNETRKLLHQWWSRDRDGGVYEIDDKVLRSALVVAAEQTNWVAIEQAARDAYPQDYKGDIVLLSRDDVTARWHWIGGAIRSQVFGTSNMTGNLLMNALDGLFALASRRYPQARDQSYCNYFLPFNQTIRTIRDTIVALASA